jgi:ADP-ribose pyrophosphatase YjhB (NUDIX family)
VIQHSNHRISNHVSITEETNLKLHTVSDIKLTFVGVNENNLRQHYSVMFFVLLLYVRQLLIRTEGISRSQSTSRL